MKNNRPAENFESRVVHYKLVVPAQFTLLCEAMNLDMGKVLCDFMASLGMESYGKGKKSTKAAVRYFLNCGYDQGRPSRTLRQMFRELKAIGVLWPKDAAKEVLEQHVMWRTRYYHYWLLRWTVGRKP